MRKKWLVLFALGLVISLVASIALTVMLGRQAPDDDLGESPSEETYDTPGVQELIESADTPPIVQDDNVSDSVAGGGDDEPMPAPQDEPAIWAAPDDEKDHSPESLLSDEVAEYPAQEQFQAQDVPEQDTDQQASEAQVDCNLMVGELNSLYWVKAELAYQWLEEVAEECAVSRSVSAGGGEGYVNANRVYCREENQYQVDNYLMREYYDANFKALDAGCEKLMADYPW